MLRDSAEIGARDSNANAAIATMVTTVVGTALVPAHVNWALTASAMGAGVVAIGLCYDVKLTKDEAWQLVKHFFVAAGAWFIAMNIGSKVFAAILSSTGVGHVGAVAIDGAISGAAAYAIGQTAKEYFRRDFLGATRPTKEELRQVFRTAFAKKKAEARPQG